ncbi:MAG: glycosyltransferase family 4 protein [Paraglaciecola sp.]
MTKVNVALVSFEFPPKIGGAGAVAYAYAKALAKKNNVHVISCAFSHYPKCQNLTGIKHTYFRFNICWPYKMYKQIPEGIDTYILNDPSALYSAGLFFTNHKLNKSIVFMHGGEIDRILKQTSYKRKLIFFRKIYLRVLTHCHSIVVPSYYYLNELTSNNLLPRNILNKCSVMYAPIKDLYHTWKSDKNLIESRTSDLNIISVSRIVESKGFPTMYEIVKSLVERGLSVNWMVVGDGDYLTILNERAEADCITDNIKLLGRLEGKELLDAYKGADVFMLLSEFKESYGLVYLEAMSQGLPVIANNFAGPAEIISSKVGFLIEEKSKAIEILENKLHKRIEPLDCIAHSSNFFGDSSINRLHDLVRTVGES